jgi:hypothetical protein
MTPLHAATALAARTDVAVELPMNGLARDLHLELLGDVRFGERATAVGAHLGQRCLMDFVDLVRGRWLAVGPGAMVLARLAAWLLGLGRRLALGEGGGLTLAGAEGLVESTAESLVLGWQIVDPSLKGLAVGAIDRVHGGNVRSSGREADHGTAGESISPGFRR